MSTITLVLWFPCPWARAKLLVSRKIATAQAVIHFVERSDFSDLTLANLSKQPDKDLFLQRYGV
jgi:hypothetical protein